MEERGRAPTGKSILTSTREGVCTGSDEVQGRAAQCQAGCSIFLLCDKGQSGAACAHTQPAACSTADGLMGWDPAHAFACRRGHFPRARAEWSFQSRACLACKTQRTYYLTPCRERCAAPWMDGPCSGTSALWVEHEG